MKMEKNIAKVFAVVFSLMAVVFVGCSDEQIVQSNQVLRPSEVLSFRISLENGIAVGTSRSTSGHLLIEEEEWTLDGSGSRASMKTSLDGKAQVLGFVKNGDELSYTSPDVNSILTFRGDELTNTTTPVFWKDIAKKEGDDLYVFAYAPQTIEGTSFEENNPTRFSYTVPGIDNNQSDKQMDIVVGTACVPKNHQKEIPLTFKHIFTAVRFKLGFECTVKSIKMEGIKNTGTYTIGNGWSDISTPTSYEFSYGNDGKTFGKDVIMGDTLMLLPQTLENAKVTMSYINKNSESKTFEATLDGKTWEEGKFITYTLRESTQGIIYLDLAAGNVTIDGNKYTGSYFKTTTDGEGKKTTEKKTITGTHQSGNNYYVYQSTSENQSTTGYVDDMFVLPVYDEVTVNVNGVTKTWSEFITNNTNVEAVIEAWDNIDGAGERGGKGPNLGTPEGAVRDVFREATKNQIHVEGNVGEVNLSIDNIYSSFHQYNGNSSINRERSRGGISFIPSKTDNSILTIKSIGDNRLGCVHYENIKSDINCLVFEGVGSLTVADADFYKYTENNVNGYYSNRSCAVIGGKDQEDGGGDGKVDHAYNIVFNSGTIFVGATKAESSTAIGGGGNGNTKITINGGTITAVASGTGTAIGGGTGLSYAGGEGEITIKSGNVYAYNFANSRSIPSSAVGGAGSEKQNGSLGTITIEGGYVYAYSALGTAIGGGSSKNTKGGNANVTIKGGQVISKSGSGAGIGGGSARTMGGNYAYNGGSATVTISGNPIIRTGSIGGGLTGSTHKDAKIGSATINISGNPDIQAQFVMAKGAGTKPTFTMSGGVIRNTDATKTFDKNVIETEEFRYTKNNGGAVYLEDGSFEMTGGTIENCTAANGGAVYINGTNNPTFTMKGGTIKNCMANGNGGAVYLQGGTVTLNTEINDTYISRNLANDGNGGGIYMDKGSFNMDGNVVIEGNSAMNKKNHNMNEYPLLGKGGGIYVTSSTENVEVNIRSGFIRSNGSDRFGGGVCVDMSEEAEASIVIGEKEGTSQDTPSITGNHTLSEGGGLYAKGDNANITIYHGTINGNSTTAYVHNDNVANEGGMVTLVGDEEKVDVPHKIVYFHANGENATFKENANEQQAIQRIVTSTNSLLVQPVYIARPGYTFVGWHTRADGDDSKGEPYKNGNVMNISADLHLYAQWQKNTN